VRVGPWLLTVALLARATETHADETLPLDLTWSAPPGCAAADDIRRELGRIARVRPGRTVARVAARGRIDHAGSSYRLSLHTEQSGVAGERTLVAKECRSLEREVTLVLALAFGEGVELVESEQSPPATTGSDTTAPSNAQSEAAASTAETPKETPDATEAAAPEPPVAPPAPATRAANRVAPPRTPAEARRSAGSARIAGLAGGGVLFGALPSPAGFVAIGSELGVRRFWLEPKFEWIPRVTQSAERGVAARYEGFGGGLAGCLMLPPDALALNACVGGEALALRGTSSGASESGDAVAPLFAGVVSVGWEWPAHTVLGLRLDAALHVAFDEPRFVVDGLGDVHQVPRFSPSVAATVIFGRGR
jgi:hypothetical protein